MLRSATATRVFALFIPIALSFASRQILFTPSAPSTTMSFGSGAFRSTMSPDTAVMAPYTSRYSGKLMSNQRRIRLLIRVICSVTSQRLVNATRSSAYTPSGL